MALNSSKFIYERERNHRHHQIHRNNQWDPVHMTLCNVASKVFLVETVIFHSRDMLSWIRYTNTPHPIPLHPYHPSQGCDQSQQCQCHHQWREKREPFWPPAQVKGYLWKKEESQQKQMAFRPFHSLEDTEWWMAFCWCLQTIIADFLFFFFLPSLLVVRCCSGKATHLWLDSLSLTAGMQSPYYDLSSAG